MRNIFIIGLGNFGFHCALRLEGRAQVTAIDVDRNRIQKIGPHVYRAVVADATSAEALQDLAIEEAEAVVVSVGTSMENSILITLHLKAIGVKKIFAKAMSDDHAKILRMLGATRVLQPEKEVAENLAMTITKPNIVDYLQLHKAFGIIEIDSPAHFFNRSLETLALRRTKGLTVIGIFRKGDRLISPDSKSVILEGDRLVLLGTEESIVEFERSLR